MLAWLFPCKQQHSVGWTLLRKKKKIYISTHWITSGLKLEIVLTNPQVQLLHKIKTQGKKEQKKKSSECIFSQPFLGWGGGVVWPEHVWATWCFVHLSLIRSSNDPWMVGAPRCHTAAAAAVKRELRSQWIRVGFAVWDWNVAVRVSSSAGPQTPPTTTSTSPPPNRHTHTHSSPRAR